MNKTVFRIKFSPAHFHFIGLAIGITRNDDILVQFCGAKLRQLFSAEGIGFSKVVGELEAVILMKAAASKNRMLIILSNYWLSL